MRFQFKIIFTVGIISTCLLNATAQTKRHFVPNRGAYPENGGSSGLGGSSIGLQKGASVQPTAVPKTITITGTYKEVQPPTPETCLAKEKKSVGRNVADSISNPALIAFTAEQFQSHALELVKELYITEATEDTPIIGYDLQERDGDIVKTAKLFPATPTIPSKDVLLNAFAKGESFLVIRKVSIETTCGMCEGKGAVQIAEILFKERPSEPRFAECTRCHGTKKSIIEIDQTFKIVLKKTD